MTKFIKLNEQGNNKVHYLNVAHIVRITVDENVTAILIGDDYLFFNQSIDDVMSLINF